MVKQQNLSKLGIDRDFLDLLKASEQSTAHVIHNDEIVNTYSIIQRKRQRPVCSPTLFDSFTLSPFPHSYMSSPINLRKANRVLGPLSFPLEIQTSF